MGFTSLIPWAEADAQRDEARNTQWRDAQRTQTIADHMRTAKNIRDQLAYVDNLHKALAYYTNPNDNKIVPGHEAEAARLQDLLKQYNTTELTANLNNVESYIQKLYDPNFNAQTGMEARSPLRALGEKMHLVKPQQQPQTAGEMMKGLRDITQKYDAAAPGIATGEKDLETATALHGREQEMQWVGQELKKLGTSDERIREIQEEIASGVKPTKATSLLGTKGSDFWKSLPAYAASIGKDVESLTWDDIQQAEREAAISRRAAKEHLVPDPQSSTGWAAEGVDGDGNVLYHVQNVSPQRGMQTRETITTDPFGVTSTTVSKPVLPGVKTPGGAPGRPTAPQPSVRQAAPKPSAAAPTPGQQIRDLKGKTAAPTAAVPQAPAPFQVDSEGHIPASANLNPQLREAANNLLDGMAVKDLQVPPRDKTAAQNLARQYGWAGQGMFTPRDRLLVRESQGILTQFAKDPSLAVLDNTTSRLRIQQVLQSPDKRGWIGQTIQALTAQGLTPQEAQFVTLYNQAVGRISGLSQLVRSGRATEAQIERLKLELPNPATTSGSVHARQKFKQIQNEIDIALQKGQFQAAGNSVDDVEKALDNASTNQ